MPVLLLWLLAACGGSPYDDNPIPPPSPTFEDPKLNETGATAAYQLYRMDGQYELPATSAPEGYDPGGEFAISLNLDKGTRNRNKSGVYRGPLPFDVGEEGRRFAPEGMEVFVDGESIPFSTSSPSSAGRKTWRVKGNKLILTYPDLADDSAVTVRYTGISDLLARRAFPESGLSESDFVHETITLDRRTREGLLLPAPATAKWTVTLPESGATFDTWLAMEPAPVLTSKSDGADVVVSVVVDGKAKEVGRRHLDGPSDAFTHWRLDLSRWKGQQVTVQISTETAGTRDFDYVFLGSPSIWGPPTGDVRRVVVIGLDTTRADYLGIYGYHREITPELDAFSRQSVVFEQAWAPAPRTRPSFRTATTGRRPLDAVGATNIAELFQREGFATAGIVANVHLQPRFGFHTGFDDWWFDGAAKAKDQVDRAMEWLERYDDRDSYMFLHIMDPHIFYRAPGSYRDKFVEDPDETLPSSFNRWQVYSMARDGSLTDKRRKHIKALYEGEMAYMSYHLGRLFDRLDRMGGNTLVVIHSDHGEEFWDHDGFEHNHTLYAEVTRSVLLVRSRQGMQEPLRIDTPATLADIAPTLFDFAGFDDLPPTDGKSLRPLIDGSGGSGWDRPIGIGHLRYGSERWAVVVDGHKYILHTGSGREELYNIRLDPTEQVDIVAGADLSPYIGAMADAHSVRVGRGWRLRTTVVDDPRPVVLTLPEPAADAGVIDPESVIHNPKNQAWGEPPRRVPEQIGTVELSEDGLTVTYTPGAEPRDGVLYVIFDKDVAPDGATLHRDDTPLPLAPNDKGLFAWSDGPSRLVIEPGTVVVPPVGEAARMRMLASQDGDAGAGSIDMLRELGYLGPDEGEDGHDH